MTENERWEKAIREADTYADNEVTKLGDLCDLCELDAVCERNYERLEYLKANYNITEKIWE